MKYISTTELRTKSTELINQLKSGQSVNLIHRSEVVGVIKPSETKPSTSHGALERFLQLAGSHKATTLTQREEVYAEHLNKKYGAGIS